MVDRTTPLQGKEIRQIDVSEGGVAKVLYCLTNVASISVDEIAVATTMNIGYVMEIIDSLDDVGLVSFVPPLTKDKVVALNRDKVGVLKAKLERKYVVKLYKVLSGL